MRWIALCFVVAGLTTGAFAQTPCPPPKVLNAAGQCVCPPGTHPVAGANICVPNCPPPKVLNAAGQCVCPPGTHPGATAANICIPDCPPPKVLNAAGACVCPPGTHQAAVANICVKN